MDPEIYERWMDEYFYTGIVPSKHLFFTADGRVRHQKKSHDISIANHSQWRKRWLVYHLVAGSRSGRFALQIASAPDPDLLVGLLRRCFEKSQKLIIKEHEPGDHILSGKPTIGTVIPRALQKAYPSLAGQVEALGSDAYSIAKGGGFKNPIVHLTGTLNKEVLNQAHPYDFDAEDFKSLQIDDEDVLFTFSDVIAEYLSLRSSSYMMWGWRRKDGSYSLVDR
jgi:hypothetical protein